MARPIFDGSEMLGSEITFFSLQPICLEYSRYSELLSKEMSLNPDDWAKISDTCDSSNGTLHQRLVQKGIDCDWVESLRRVRHYDLWINLNPMNAFNADLDALNNDNEEFKFLNYFTLDRNKSGYFLCFDSSNYLFLIVYKLVLSCTEKVDGIDDQLKLKLNSLYRNVRDLLVVDPVNENHDVPEWTKSIRKFCISEAYSTYSSVVKLNRSDLYVRNNTGYVAAFFNSAFCTDPIFSSVNRDEFLQHNHFIDRVNEEKAVFRNLDILESKESQDLFLGWRHSTVWGVGQDKCGWLLSLMIHLQCHYFTCHLFYKAYLEELFADIRYETKRRRNFDHYLTLFDQLVLTFQNLYYLRERFLNDIKPIYREVYDKMEAYWGLDEDYKSIDRAISICQDSVDRKVQIADSLVQKRQSNILFFLAIVQIFSFIGIFGDYFNFFKINVTQSQKGMYIILKQYLLPVLFVSASLALIVTYSDRVMNSAKYLFRGLSRNRRK